MSCHGNRLCIFFPMAYFPLFRLVHIVDGSIVVFNSSYFSMQTQTVVWGVTTASVFNKCKQLNKITWTCQVFWLPFLFGKLYSGVGGACNKGHPLISLTECLTKTTGPQQKFIRLTISCKFRVIHCCCVVIHLVKTAVSLYTWCLFCNVIRGCVRF